MRTMFDQIIIGDKASNDDFGASVSARYIADPVKKKITKTVPFSNATYDFTTINGEIYWEQRELKYEFEMLADTPEELEEMKTAFSNYVMNVIDEKIYDPYIHNYHFVGTYESKECDDDESGEKTTMTVKFLAYPYKVANAPKMCSRTIESYGNAVMVACNESSHRITPTIKIDGDVRIVYGNISYAASSGTVEDERFSLAVGLNSFYVENIGDSECTVEICFTEEIF